MASVIRSSPPIESDAGLKQRLLERGLIKPDELHKPDSATRRENEPITVEGQPISESLLQERR